MQTKSIQFDIPVRALKIALAFLFLVVVSMSSWHVAYAKTTDLEYSGWVPWWQDKEGSASAEDHIRDLDTVYPFVYEVNSAGGLVLKTDLEDRHWEDLFDEADDRRVEVIPTIAWFDGASIHQVLSDRKLRSDHIDAIVEMVEDGDFDGVNIDYESKLATTIDYFSTFLEELHEELDDKVLTCTLEARTPPESLYRVVPASIEYANDYKKIAKYCDRVEIMAYDQQRVDWKLNDEKSGQPYIPVADADWVRKVIERALEEIPEEKIILGIPTYGRQWTLQVAPNWFKEYKSVGAINLPDAQELARDYKVTPSRNRAGEMSYTFFPESSIFKILTSLPVPDGTPKGGEAAAQALLFANYTGMTVPVNVVWYSDAHAIEEKLDLAREYSLRGIALFKIDGEEDQDVWDLF